MTTPISTADPNSTEGDTAHPHLPPEITFRSPTIADARGVQELVQRSGGLDCNSRYAYLLICDHFAATSVVATRDRKIVGVATAYVQPANPDTLFIWQVAVDPVCRGQGVGKTLLREMLQRPACRAVQAIETTVSPSNAASRGMFAALAKAVGATIQERSGYPPDLFIPEDHEAEALLRLAPVNPQALNHS